MKKTFSKKKSAFSLIELSIVLIIIGLLIAGITGGASLIKSSELRSVMSEARGYSVAVNSFYNRFGALPGDYGTAVGGIATALGDADGKIEYYSSATPTGGTKSESAAAWIHLRYSSTIDNLPLISAVVEATTAPTFGNASLSTANAPSSKIRGAGWAFDYRTLTENASNSPANQNVVVLSSAIGTSVTAGTATLVVGTNVSTASLLGADALSIDSKIDDGHANNGKIRGLSAGNGTGCYTPSTSANAAYITTSTTTANCSITYQVDVNS